VETASPTRLVIMLYDGAIRFCMIGLDAMRKRDLESQHTHLLKAQRILTELMSSLDREAGGEIAANLFRVYTYLMEELVKANLYDEPARVEQALKMLRELRESWLELDRAGAPEGDLPGTPSLSAARQTEGLPPSLTDSPAGTGPIENRKSKIENRAGAAPPPSRLGDRRA
jgi:flagellar protein FliS